MGLSFSSKAVTISLYLFRRVFFSVKEEYFNCSNSSILVFIEEILFSNSKYLEELLEVLGSLLHKVEFKK